MWTEQLQQSGGPFLFGGFSAADAFYAPVCARLRDLFGRRSRRRASAYVDRILALPAMQSWCDAARAEQDFIAEDEPYRQSSG